MKEVDRSRRAGRGSIGYFWPAPSIRVLDSTIGSGMPAVREMTNCCVGTAKTILDDAFDRVGIASNHSISKQSIVEERAELRKYKGIFSSNPMVDRSLIDNGVDPERIIRTSFGWSPKRFENPGPIGSLSDFTVLFVGRVCVRKGVPQILEAWRRSAIEGRLIFVGDVEPAIEPLLANYRSDPSIVAMKYSEDLATLYRSAHIFVFPSLEEGGPQVVYEAAGCGLPVVSTEMGGGRLVTHRRNGLIVEPFDADGLARAMVLLHDDPELRVELGRQAAIDALEFTYEKVGLQRAATLRRLALE